MIMENKISNEDLQTLREDIQKERKAYYKGEYRNGWLAMVDECLSELQEYRKNAKTVTIDLNPKTAKKLMENAVKDVLSKYVIKCAKCGNEIDLGEIFSNTSGGSNNSNSAGSF